MRFLKSEYNQRHHDFSEHCREGIVEKPEDVCNIDITRWRDDSHAYHNFRRDGDKQNWSNEGVDIVRRNDVQGMTRDINIRYKSYKTFSEAMLRTSL